VPACIVGYPKIDYCPTAQEKGKTLGVQKTPSPSANAMCRLIQRLDFLRVPGLDFCVALFCIPHIPQFMPLLGSTEVFKTISDRKKAQDKGHGKGRCKKGKTRSMVVHKRLIAVAQEGKTVSKGSRGQREQSIAGCSKLLDLVVVPSLKRLALFGAFEFVRIRLSISTTATCQVGDYQTNRKRNENPEKVLSHIGEAIQGEEKASVCDSRAFLYQTELKRTKRKNRRVSVE
jgi:hypothetical protein